ncbi:MAG: hypothetical protein FJY97_00150 [candidate division Zixibacteria bacterium]|nr:hypothetical protein [candidate division Zixibacteria bacterium]
MKPHTGFYPVLFFLSVFLCPVGGAAQESRPVPLGLGALGGLNGSSGNPAVEDGAFYVEGQMEIDLTGPFSLLGTAGCVYTSGEGHAGFPVNLYSLCAAVKATLSPSAHFRPFVAAGPALFYYDPEKKVDQEDALMTFGGVEYAGTEYLLTRHWKIAALAGIALTGSDVARFPLSGPRSAFRASVHLGTSVGLFFRF